ncbi:MAG: family 20 glycosylhydrolase, partial [Prevotellaceae bacterium]|nr:family 20 glycosylhydrolase [Prevotellaceae bacterium]
SAQAAATAALIPLPEKCTMQAGQFVLNASTKIALTPNDAAMQGAVAVFNDLLQSAAGFSLPVVGSAGSNAIVCTLNPKLKGDEAYKLKVQKNKIQVEAKTPRGIFYALQTVRQLLPQQIEAGRLVRDVAWAVPCLEVEDAPRYGYRGLLLDVARHFMTKQEVMRYIDLLAYHKLNTFHWHLTEDQGWRIEIKKYPKLTKTGAFREQTREGYIDKNGKKQGMWDNKRHGGFYTQEEVKEVLAYAAKRFVNVIPEIDMPGHMLAALAAYPELSCSGGPFRVEGRWGVHNDILCAGKDTTFAFMENILTEIVELFPSHYIHIGGDEAPKVRWKHCCDCQAKIKALGLKDEHELQSYFITRIEKFLNSKGKKIIGWDEILEGGLAPDATVMSWRGVKGGIAAAKQHHDVIMTPNSHLYLNYCQISSKTEPYCNNMIALETAYSYDPTPAELTPDEAKYILGVQGNMWTEHTPTFDHVLHMAYPRAAAVAEIGWSPKEQKNYNSFITRLQQVAKRYEAMGITTYSKAFLGEEKATADNRATQLRNNLFARNKSAVLVVAHRGDWRYAPENSIAAIEHSIQVGVDVVEIDLQLTKDSVLILMHDSNLDRTTTGKGRIASWTMDSIRTLYLKNGASIKTKEKVPTLEEALLAAKGKVLLNLDKADRYFDLVYRVLQKTGTAQQIIMKGSGSPEEVKKRYGKSLDEVIYMPIVKLDEANAEAQIEQFVQLLSPVAFELLFVADTNPLPKKLPAILNGKALIWYNTLWDTMAGGHDDDMALDNPQAAYGYLIDSLDTRIIQTDRAELLLNFLRQRKMHE